jgi:DNA-binding GntR family transcriptional regulator
LKGFKETPMNTSGLSAIEPPPLLRERAFEHIRDAIITGTLKPGTRLIERELCAATGVSRPSIREVIRRLEAERLIDVEPRRGPVVAVLTHKQAFEIYELRAMLEARLIERFTELATEQQIAQLRRIVADFEKACAKEAVTRILAIMHRFKKHVIGVVDHEIFDDILNHVDARISWLRVTSMSKPGRIQASMGEIRAILEAVERRDKAGAAEAMRRYVTNARDAALEQLKRPSPSVT